MIIKHVNWSKKVSNKTERKAVAEAHSLATSRNDDMAMLKMKYY